MRRTIVVAGGTAASAMRLHAARQGWHGAEIRTVEHVAERLAGGFSVSIDSDRLAESAAQAIRSAAREDLGDLVSIAGLPGLPGALVATLDKVWLAGLDLAQLAAEQPACERLATLARLEAAILPQLPPAMLRPTDLARKALARLRYAPAVLGPVTCGRLLDIAPVWHELLDVLGSEPGWWRPAPPEDLTAQSTIRVITAATARHEVIEAMRWARGLLATGRIQAQDIALAAAAPGEYDDLVFAMSQDANLDIHFAHGRRALTTGDGQAAAALADILLNGLSQDRVRRLARLAHDPATPFGRLPENWDGVLPRAAPLGSPQRWRQATTGIAAEIVDVLLPAIDLLAEGVARAEEAGEVFLRGIARLLWRRGLARAPAAALETTLGSLKLPDSVEPGASIGWMQASALASAPRPYVWLFGLNARTWPRASTEDPLLPNHIIPSSRLQPVPVTQLDRLAFRSICAATAQQVVCSASRRDATGRMLGLSPLLPRWVQPERLRRARIPTHAMSEQDRLMARPAEFAGTARARSAIGCWRDWNSPGITAHDGLVRPDHPALLRALDRTHSATSLKSLLRNPLGFTWKYALHWQEPDRAEEAMNLDPMQFGGLVHEILDDALLGIEEAGGLGTAGKATIAKAVTTARKKIAARWEAEQPVPPALLWALRLDEAEEMAVTALAWPLDPYPGQVSQGELPFGVPDATPGNLVWDSSRPIKIPGTALRIQGRIDRLDLAANGRLARVIDYKTGQPRDPGILNGGSELQRCLYAYAVKSLLGAGVRVEAALLFPRGENADYYKLEDTEAALHILAEALLHAHKSLQSGNALPGPDTAGTYDDLAFALPASQGALTDHKRTAAKEMLGEAAAIWDQE